MPRKAWSGNAVKAKLNGAISGTPPTFAVDVATGFPTGSTQFVITVDRGLSSEEKMLVTRSGTTFTVVTRGHDGTTQQDHANQATVEHTIDASTIDEANDHVNTTSRDDHTQYLNNARHDTVTRHPVSVLPTGTSSSTVSLGNHTHTYQWSTTFGIQGSVLVPSGDVDFIPPVFVPVLSGRTVKLVAARHKINSGTSATVKLQKNDVDITGFTSLAVTTTATTTDPADVTLADGDKIALVVTGVSGNPQNLSFSLYFEQS